MKSLGANLVAKVMSGTTCRLLFKFLRFAFSQPQIAGDQPSAEAEGCVRLRDHLFAERVQHLHRLPALPVHLRGDRRAAVQREVLLLHR